MTKHKTGVPAQGGKDPKNKPSDIDGRDQHTEEDGLAEDTEVSDDEDFEDEDYDDDEEDE